MTKRKGPSTTSLKALRAGITLIELLMAMSISIMLLAALYAVYSTSYQAYKSSINKAELNQNARISLERIGRDLHQTSQIITIIPIDDTNPLNPPANELQFVDGHNTAKIQYIRYFRQNNDLRRQVIHYYFSSDIDTWVAWNAQDDFDQPPIEQIDEDVIKADKITSLKFFGDNLVTIQITASNNYGNYNYQTKVLGRNI